MTSCALLLLSAAAAGQLPQNVLLNFSATWCGPCRQVKPTVNKLIRQGYPVRRIDIDRDPALRRRFRIRGVPTFVLIVNGQEVDRVSGVQSERDLRGMLARIPKRRLPDTATAPIPEKPPASLYAERSPKRRFQPPRSADAGATGRRRPLGRRSGVTIRGNNPDQPLAEPTAIPADPLAASVRIRVRDGNGINYGSGTVIDGRRGRAIILTCAHLFRGVKGDAAVEVDLYEGTRVRRFRGTVITHDLKADVGLISISTDEPIPSVPLAGPRDPAHRGDRVFGIGCGGGDPPKRLAMQVTGVNRYLGPDNLECTGMPQQGRSGGGLFDGQGRLIGVCFAAEPKNRRGLYAGLRPIRALLKRADVRLRPGTASAVATATETSPDPGTTTVKTREASTESKPAVRIDQRQLALMQVPLTGRRKDAEQVADFDPGPFPFVTPPPTQPRTSAPPKRADEHRLKTVDDVVGTIGEAEVICIIRPLGDPRAESRVVIINRASAKFTRYLFNEVGQRPRKTMRSVKSSRSAGGLSPRGLAAVRNLESRKPADRLASPFRPVTAGPHSTLRPTAGRYRRSAHTRFAD
ncbi:MAG: trypsin-like peptidase domain-containing protein [Planctomycetaceae bacterium]